MEKRVENYVEKGRKDKPYPGGKVARVSYTQERNVMRIVSHNIFHSKYQRALHISTGSTTTTN